MTPYDIVFAREEFEETLFPAISDDALTHTMDTHNADEFLQLPGTRTVLEQISPPGQPDAPPIPGVAALAFHGYHYWLHGHRTDVFDEETTRVLLDPASKPIGEWKLAAPEQAGYVQFPANLIWASTDQGTPEPVHGFFYTTSVVPPGGSRLDLLVALGVREDRPGVTAIEINVTLPVFPPGHFGDLDARDDGDDFANILPGGELRGLYAVTNAGEVLKLVSRALHFIGAAHG